jgi:cell wall-associated NlpC family hydrolase
LSRPQAADRRLRLRALLAGVSVLLGSCSLFAPRPQLGPAALAPPANSAQPAALGDGIARSAAALIGVPYEFGGADLGGFDCSGLAVYVHAQAGISIPRTAAEQQRAALAVPLSALRPGDLVFFRMGTHGVDHVGIYLGDGRFVHAPHRGGTVVAAQLNEAFYARHLVNAGRFWSSAASPP